MVSHHNKGRMVDTYARTMDAHQNAFLTSNQDEQEAARVIALEQQVQSLNQSLSQIMQQNQDLTRRLAVQDE